jgi:hypothetical protein
VGAVQVAMPRIPFKLDANQDSRDRGAALFWKAALADWSRALDPQRRLDILFGLYALGDGGQRNREAFIAAARDVLPGSDPALSPVKSGAVGAAACFAAGCAAAWFKRRRAGAAYFVGLAALAVTGAAGLLATFGIRDFTGIGLSPGLAFVLFVCVMGAVGLFAERAAAFDWRRQLKAEQ